MSQQDGNYEVQSEIGAGALFGPILRASEAKKRVPPVMHDLIIFRALFDPTEVLLIGTDIQYEKRPTDQTVGHACDLTCNSDLPPYSTTCYMDLHTVWSLVTRCHYQSCLI